MTQGTRTSGPERARILCVDDDPDILRMLELQLREEFDVSIASSGAEALHLFDEQGPFAAVVADMRMPRLNGAQLLGEIRRRDPSVVRILLTGDADLDSAMQAVNEGYVFRYLTKPCPREQLRHALRAAVTEHVIQRASSPTPPGDEDEPTMIAGRYRLGSTIGHGTSASVLQATDTILNEEIAIKIFAHTNQRAFLQRVKREASVARRLAHSNVVRIHDIGVDGGRIFLTMELLSGIDLRQMIERRVGDLALRLDCVVQACCGLQHAHDKGITHRDVKPENLFLCDDDVLRVMDFGLAKNLTAPGITMPEEVGGTLAYISPEQLEHFSSVSHLTDVYALGAILYELLTGTPPFQHQNPMALMMQHLTKPVTPPSERDPSIPEGLDDIVLRALAKAPAERFQSCEELAHALRSVRSRLSA